MINIDLVPFSLQNVCADDSNGKKTASTSFTPYSISKHCDVFCGRSLGGSRKITLTALLTLAMKCFSLLWLEKQWLEKIVPAYVRSLTVWDHNCYLKRLTLMAETRSVDPYTLTQSLDDLTGNYF